jgi:chromosome segregation ATPase
MRDFKLRYLAATMAAVALGWGGLAADACAAQKIICWKDKAGKTIGCGDRVPPEYQDNATRELDKAGVTRKTTENAEERAKREAQEKELSAQKAEEKKQLAEQKRQDAALLNAFTNVKEIDLKRDRDLQVVDGQLTQLRVSHKNAADRQAEIKARMDATVKSGKPATETQKEDLAHAAADMAKAERSIAEREKEKEAINKRYADMKARYTTLKGGGTPAQSPASVPVPATAAKK